MLFILIFLSQDFTLFSSTQIFLSNLFSFNILVIGRIYYFLGMVIKLLLSKFSIVEAILKKDLLWRIVLPVKLT